MRYRKLTADDDYTFGGGQLDFYRDVPEAVGQSVKTRILLWLGEWYLDVTLGTKYMQGIFGKHSKQLADATIQNRVTTTTGVVDIPEYLSTVDADTRKIDLEFTINTIYGPTQVEVGNYANY